MKLMDYKAYRYVDSLYSSGDDEYGYHTRQSIYLLELNVVKETEKGFWVEDIIGRRRFVRLNGRRRYACLSKEDARESFIRRKQAQRRILLSQLKFCEQALLGFGLTLDYTSLVKGR